MYTAPLTDMRFVLEEVAGLPALASLPGYQEATPDLVTAVLDEAGKLAGEVLAPLNHPGDRAGSRYENGAVRTPEGFTEAYRAYVEAGWNALPFDPDYGGQGLPWTLSSAVQEMWQSANMSWALCPLLTTGAVELLQEHGSRAQKDTFLPKLIAGAWTGTMNLTEPQAGSDVGALKAKAVPRGNGSGEYLITGQKIYITYGEHDMAENIVHMVLARTPDAPPGTKGISLFLVPKFLPGADGRPGPRNDLRCGSIEHKLGIRASPTAVMLYGENGGAVGTLIGEENQGMACMFTMMNNARLAVGIQGLAIAERAYQQALAYARDRVQSRPLGGGAQAVPIIRHPDVRRMLMTMKASTEASRALGYYTAAALDRSKRHPDAEEKARNRALNDLLTPIAKAWLSDIGCEVASLGVQVHGGMGFIEETGAAQHLRDARINPIYEGTNGIQALDLLGRKLLRDKGAAARALIAEMRATGAALEVLQGEVREGDDLAATRRGLARGLDDLDKATRWLLDARSGDPEIGAAGATPYLRLFGTAIGGWLLARLAHSAAGHLAAPAGAKGFDRGYLTGKIATARFYAENLMPQTGWLAAAVTQGAGSTLALHEGQF